MKEIFAFGVIGFVMLISLVSVIALPVAIVVVALIVT